MRDGAEDVEHELAGGRGGVEALLEADQVDATGLEVVDGLEQLPERAPQTVGARDAQAVSGPVRGYPYRLALSGTLPVTMPNAPPKFSRSSSLGV